jgi:hypothetical protein
LDGQLDRDIADRFSVFSAAEPQPFEQWGHAESRAAFRESSFQWADNHRESAKWFDPNAFLAPSNIPANGGFYGNVGRDTLVGPGLATWDFSALKDTRITERLNIQFRAEIFNLLNRANFNLPNAVVFTPSGVSPNSGSDHEHFDYFTAGTVRFEVALVKPSEGLDDSWMVGDGEVIRSISHAASQR